MTGIFKITTRACRHYWRALHIACTFALRRPFLFVYTSPYGNSFLILTCTQSGEPIAAGKLYLSAIGAAARPVNPPPLVFKRGLLSETNICFFYRFSDLAWCIIIDSKFPRKEKISSPLIVSGEKKSRSYERILNWLTFKNLMTIESVFSIVVSFSPSNVWSWLKAFPFLAVSASIRI